VSGGGAGSSLQVTWLKAFHVAALRRWRPLFSTDARAGVARHITCLNADNVHLAR